MIRSRSMGSKTEDTLDRVEVHEDTEEMESVLVRGDGGIAIAMFVQCSKQGVVTLLRLVVGNKGSGGAEDSRDLKVVFIFLEDRGRVLEGRLWKPRVF